MIQGRGIWLFGISMVALLSARAAAGGAVSPGGLLATTRHAPDEFGEKDYTVTTIGFPSFTPASDDNFSSPPYYTGSTIYTRTVSFSQHQHFFASVSIPSGSVIDFIGLQSVCRVASVAGVSLTLVDRNGAATPIGAFSCTQHEIGTDYNASPIGFQLVRNVHNMLVLDVEIANPSTGSHGQLAWVEVWWKRVVSPPPASATFGDVSPANPQFRFIEALYAAGITGGCGGGNFCPDSPITRGQMAVFLATALGLHWPY